jgi:hypothetical protein
VPSEEALWQAEFEMIEAKETVLKPMGGSPSAISTGSAFLTGCQPHRVHGSPSSRIAEHSGHVVSAGPCGPVLRLAWERFSARLSSCNVHAISSSGNPCKNTAPL